MIVCTLRPEHVVPGNGSRPWLRLTVHDSVSDLRRLGSRVRPGEDFTEAIGLFQPARWREFYDRSSRKWLPVGNGFAGTIRVCREHLATEIIAHECAHAAAHLYRRYHRQDGALGDDCGPDEEVFAFYLGELVAKVNDALHESGVLSGTGPT